nr:MAG TPA: hypothetical protein [Caudoviricetes sp.]
MRAFFSLSHYLYIKKIIYNMLKYLLIVAVILCVAFCSLQFFNLPWVVVLFSGNAVNSIVSLILGFAVAILIYDNEDNDEKR